jgi:plant G-box-binding factor
MRRKQSNRESARRSRLRKQAECEQLGRQVKDLLQGEADRLLHCAALLVCRRCWCRCHCRHPHRSVPPCTHTRSAPGCLTPTLPACNSACLPALPACLPACLPAETARLKEDKMQLLAQIEILNAKLSMSSAFGAVHAMGPVSPPAGRPACRPACLQACLQACPASCLSSCCDDACCHHATSA